MRTPIIRRRTSPYVAKLGCWSAVLTTALTIVTWVIAFMTPPMSGPLCTAGCFGYPYGEAVARFPRDYIWMYPAMALYIASFALVVCLHYFAPREKRVFSHIALSLALVASATLIIDYYLQVSVIQQSLVQNETDGIALLTQFNPHGIFLGLENVGYVLMTVAFLFLAPVFPAKSRLMP